MMTSLHPATRLATHPPSAQLLRAVAWGLCIGLITASCATEERARDGGPAASQDQSDGRDGSDGAVQDDIGAPSDLSLAGELGADTGAGQRPDVGFPSTQDTDGDGLCDNREVAAGTDRFEPDTDRDGITDYYEFIAGMDATNPTVPRTGDLYFLAESPGLRTTVPVRRRVEGNGEDYSGAFVSTSVTDPDGIDAGDLYLGSTATGALPPGHVALVDQEQERYFGVLGSTDLGFAVDFEVPAGLLPRGCLRVYPFRYEIKRSDGGRLVVERRFVVMTPVGGTLGSADWCSPSFCI